MLYFVIETRTGFVERIWDCPVAAANHAYHRTLNTGVAHHSEAREG